MKSWTNFGVSFDPCSDLGISRLTNPADSQVLVNSTSFANSSFF